MVHVLILGAGKGKRMNAKDLPKVLYPFAGAPLITYVVRAVKESGVCARPTLVVGFLGDKVRALLGDAVEYVEQKEQLGTGHAVSAARGVLEGRADHVLVLNGDHPLIRPQTIRGLAERHETNGAAITMATTTVPDFSDWRACFAEFGRIVRDEHGAIVRIVEAKDATPSEREIREVHPTIFCFRADWLWRNISSLSNKNAQGEYYITDLIGLATSQGIVIDSFAASPEECLGVNTPEQLKFAEEMFARHARSAPSS